MAILVLGTKAPAQRPTDFPDLSLGAAERDLRQRVDGAYSDFDVVDIKSYEPDQRVVILRFTRGPLESARALFEWDYGELLVKRPAGPMKGAWGFRSFLDARARGPSGGVDPTTRRAVDTMQRIINALREYHENFNLYPVGDVTALGKGFFRYYLGERLASDPWGRPWMYRCESGHHYVLASGGRDGALQLPPEELASLARDGPVGRLPTLISSDLKSDLVVTDGTILFGIEAQPIDTPISPVTRIQVSRPTTKKQE